MMYTGYFAQVEKYRQSGLIPVSIARISPNWFLGARIPELAPSGSLLKDYKSGLVTEEQFKVRYLKQIDKVDWVKVMFTLRNINCIGDIVFLCYEKPEDFCHRHILAEYFTEAGYFIQEYKIERR